MTSCVKTGWGAQSPAWVLSHHGSSEERPILALHSWVDVGRAGTKAGPEQVGSKARHCQRGGSMQGYPLGSGVGAEGQRRRAGLSGSLRARDLS